jgi:hypothetical protein
MIATIATGEWLKLWTGWQMSRVNIVSELCTTIPSVSGIPPSRMASATIAAVARSGRRNLVASLKTAPLPI